MADETLLRERVTATFGRMPAYLELALWLAGDRCSTGIRRPLWRSPVLSWSPVDLMQRTIPDLPTVT
jgi:hypothetical protein